MKLKEIIQLGIFIVILWAMLFGVMFMFGITPDELADDEMLGCETCVI